MYRESFSTIYIKKAAFVGKSRTFVYTTYSCWLQKEMESPVNNATAW